MPLPFSITSISNIVSPYITATGNVSNSNFNALQYGIVWNRTGTPTIASHDGITIEPTGSSTFTSTLTDLIPNTKYYARAYEIIEGGTTIYSNGSVDVIFINAISPTVTTTDPITGITQTTATGGGTVTDDGGGINSVGVAYGTSPKPTTGGTKSVGTYSGTGVTFSCPITGLTPQTHYYVAAYATNNKGIAYGSDVEFDTLITDVPIITVDAVSDITQTTATGGGNVTSDGGDAIYARGVIWSTGDTNPTFESYNDGGYTTETGTTGAFISHLTGLIENTHYYVNAYATNGVGNGYSDTPVEFDTLPPVPTAPIIGNITQPTCVDTASVDLSGLPDGNWTLNWTDYNYSGSTTGSTTGITINNLMGYSTTYYFTVTNNGGTSSPNDAYATIDAAPTLTINPYISADTDCDIPTGIIIIDKYVNDLSNSNSWTLYWSGQTSGSTTGGTGSTCTLFDLASGDYYFWAIDEVTGCVSAISSVLTINPQPSTPTAPIIGTIIQPTDLIPTGSVLITGLPDPADWVLVWDGGHRWTSGSGTGQTLITDLTTGNHIFYVVNNESGCQSPDSDTVTIVAASTPPDSTTTELPLNPDTYRLSFKIKTGNRTEIIKEYLAIKAEDEISTWKNPEEI